MDQAQFLEMIKSLIRSELNNMNIGGHWHVGKIDTTISRYAANVFVDGLSESFAIPCNPDVVFVSGDEVWVHYVNGDSKNKYIHSKRATGTESYSGGGSSFIDSIVGTSPIEASTSGSAVIISIDPSSASTSGSMSSANFTKLLGIASGANNYTHPNHTGDITSTGDGVTAITAGVIVNADINAGAAIDPTKIGTGAVSSTEFGYLDGVTSAIQTQLNSKNGVYVGSTAPSDTSFLWQQV